MEESKKMLGTTPNGKELCVRRDNMGDYVFFFNGGGEVPDELAGVWTNWAKVEARARSYLESKVAEAARKVAPANKKAS